MSARFDLSALLRRRSAKFILASLSAIAVVALVAFTARAWRTKMSATAKRDNAAAQPTPTPNTNSYIRRGLLQPRLQLALNALGDRLEKPDKERLTLVGTLTRQNNSQAVPVRLFLELPRRMRLEEQGAQQRVVGFDGSKGWASGAALSSADQDTIETLVFDSVDNFFLGQMQGVATRTLGSRFRLDDGRTANYTGPFYNIYQVTDRIKIGAANREQPKLFYFNSDTKLIERVYYQVRRDGSTANVEIR